MRQRVQSPRAAVARRRAAPDSGSLYRPTRLWLTVPAPAPSRLFGFRLSFTITGPSMIFSSTVRVRERELKSGKQSRHADATGESALLLWLNGRAVHR